MKYFTIFSVEHENGRIFEIVESRKIQGNVGAPFAIYNPAKYLTQTKQLSVSLWQIFKDALVDLKIV